MMLSTGELRVKREPASLENEYIYHKTIYFPSFFFSFFAAATKYLKFHHE